MVKLLLHNLHFVLCSVFSYENSCVSHEALVFEQPYMNIEDVQALGLWVLCYLIQNVFKFCSHFVYFCFTQKTSEELVIMKPWLTTRPNAAQNWNVTGGKSYLTRFGAWITSRNLPTGFLLLISTGLITKQVVKINIMKSSYLTNIVKIWKMAWENEICLQNDANIYSKVNNVGIQNYVKFQMNKK
mgnify:CR=1 FL=1